MIVLPGCDIAIRYKNIAEGSPVRIFFNPQKLRGLLTQDSTTSVELYQDFSAADRVGPPEKILLSSYLSASIINLKQVAFNSDFKDRNDYSLSPMQWSKESVCSWIHLAPDTAKLVEEYAIYDAHSIGKKKTIHFTGGSVTHVDPIEDYKIVFWKMGKQTFMICKRAGSVTPGSEGKFVIEYQIQKNSLSPSKPSIDLTDPQWLTFYW